MKLEQYQFDKDKPQADNLGMRLLKGGLRSVTGLIGKRGNQGSDVLHSGFVSVRRCLHGYSFGSGAEVSVLALVLVLVLVLEELADAAAERSARR